LLVSTKKKKGADHRLRHHPLWLVGFVPAAEPLPPSSCSAKAAGCRHSAWRVRLNEFVSFLFSVFSTLFNLCTFLFFRSFIYISRDGDQQFKIRNSEES
jgi:hypothetical protein